ncbi:DUF1801 domain-containing protein [Mucilaginibacter terrae]|uniref:DUF1801 domain-containing protein n=1 Tax=Mucilaginibacter terrae TaxID=1955052 RepID=UPI00363FA6FB
MAKAKDVNDATGVTAHIQKFDQPLAELVENTRQVILSTDHPAIGEHIKWNSPSFFYTGAMQPFDPKEYKRDIVVVNINRKNQVLLVFPTGIKVKDVSPILEGNYTDGRRMVSISDIDDLKAKAQQLQQVILEWLKLIDG